MSTLRDRSDDGGRETSGRFGWLRARLVVVGMLVAGAVLVAGLSDGGAALADGSACGTSTGVPEGATVENNWTDLQAAVQAVANGYTGSFYLSAPIVSPGAQNLAITAGATVTLDLDGCDLTISDVPAGDAAISVPATASLTVEDTSNSDTTYQGTLTATGGSDTNYSSGAGAGIGGDGGSTGASGGTVTIDSGNVDTTGGSGGTYDDSSGGAGIGGGGGFSISAGNGGALTVNGGTLTATGGTGGWSAGGGAAIGGGGAGGGDPSQPIGGALDGDVTITAGTVIANGGPSLVSDESNGGGGGAAIGGGGGGYYGPAGALAISSTLTVSGGTLTAVGGAGQGDGGGGAAIGGGGGDYDVAGGALDGTLAVAGGSVTATGGPGGIGTPGAAVGGGGGGYNGGSSGDGGPVTISAGSLVASQAGGGAGIGAGTAGPHSGSTGSEGSLEVLSGGSGTPSVTGELAGTLTVDADANLAVPAGDALALDGTGENDGTILLGGALTGTGSLTNAGSITVSGTGWSADGHGPGAVPGASVTGNAFDLGFHVPSGTAPADMWVFAPTVASSGETLPAISTASGPETVSWEDSGGTVVTDDTPLSPLASGGLITLTTRSVAIKAHLSSAHPKTKYGWWRSPVTVTFTCTAPSGGSLTGSCPKPVRLTRSARGQTVSRTIHASDGTSAHVSISGINIDQHRPTVKIAGPRSHHTYHGKAPKSRCSASEHPSGIASCRLTTHRRKIKHGFRVTVAAKATTKAGVAKTVTLTYTVKRS